MDSKTFDDRAAELESALELLGDVPARLASLDARVLQCQSEVRGELSAIRQDLRRVAETLRIETRAGDAETRRYMRVLHEEVLSRVAAISRR